MQFFSFTLIPGFEQDEHRTYIGFTGAIQDIESRQTTHYADTRNRFYTTNQVLEHSPAAGYRGAFWHLIRNE
ncbi:hypothetical protein D3C80_1964680 [compost metagenome]